jgi:membrane protease YdiL (CAAX protease family)
MVLLQTILHLLGYENPSLFNLLIYTVSGILLVWYAWRKKIRLEKERRVFTFGKVPWLLYLILIPVCLSVSVITDPVNVLLPMPDIFERLFESLGQHDIYTFMMVCITGPLIEELFFRGIVLNGLLKLFNPRKAILLSAIVFGIFHGNPWQFVPAFIIGLILGYVYWKTHSLLPCLFAHWFNNTASWLSAVLLMKDVENFWKLFDNHLWYFLLLASSFIILLISIYLLRSFLEKNQVREAYSAGAS